MLPSLVVAGGGTSGLDAGVWRVHDGSVAARVPVPAGVRVSGVAVNVAGTLLATYDPAGNAYLSDTASGESSVWRVTDGSLVGEVAGYASDVAFLPDGRGVAVVGLGLFTTTFDPRSAVATICRAGGRDLTADEWRSYAGDLDRERACL
jgi:hypothetical protein